MRLKRTNRLRLATLVTIGVCATVLITMLALLMLVGHFAKSYARDQAKERLQRLSLQMSESMNRSMVRVTEQVRFVSQLEDVRDARTPAQMRVVFDNLDKNLANFAWIGLADQTGTVVAASSGLLEGHNLGRSTWFMNGQRGLYTSDYHPEPLLELMLPYADKRWRFVEISVPVVRSDGTYRGVLGVQLSWEWARKIAADLLIPSDSQYMVDVLIVRDDDTIILGPDYLEESKIDVASVDLAQMGRNGAIAERWPDGRRYLTGYASTHRVADQSGGKWSILIRQPEEIALATFHGLERQIVMAGGGIGLLLALVAVSLARRLAKPLDDLSAAIGRRNQDGQPDSIPIIGGYREIQLLSVTLADMVQREREHVTKLRLLNENLERLVQERTSEIEQKAEALEASLAQQMVIQTRLQDSEAELRATLQNANDAFIAMDQDGIVVEWNEQAERLLGWTCQEAIGRKAVDVIIPGALHESFAKGMQRFLATGESNVLNRRIEITAVRRDGVEFPIELAVACVPRQNGYLFIAFLHDITERQMLQASLTAMALKDPLTDLPNRRAMMQKLPESMARVARHGKPLAVFFLDLDGFKGVNDSYGHDAGDELLRTMAQRIVGVVRATDTVVRLAGDEFVVVLEMLNDESGAIEVADKILHAIQQPFVLTSATVTVTASIGIAMHHADDPTTPDQLITRADGAMYAAKKNGKNRAVAV